MGSKKKNDMVVLSVSENTATMGYAVNGRLSAVASAEVSGSLAKTLSALASKVGAKQKDVLLGLPRTEVVTVGGLEFARMSEEQLLTNLPLSFSDYIKPNELFEYEYDYVVKGRQEDYQNNIQGYIVEGSAVRKERLEYYTGECRTAGLRLVRVVPVRESFISLIRSGIENGVIENKKICFIEINEHSTLVSVFEGETYAFEREIEDKGYDTSEAGEWDDPYRELAEDIERSLIRYDVDEIYLAGKGALAGGLREIISSEMSGTPVRLVSELMDAGISEETACTAFKIAGLAMMQGSSEEKGGRKNGKNSNDKH